MGDINFTVTGDNTGFLRSLQEARAATTEASASIKESFASMGEAFELVSKGMLILTSVLAGGKVFSEAINATVDLTKESILLGRQFGISATEASDLKVALANTFVTQEQLSKGASAMTRTLRTHEDAFKSLGVATRDQSGHYRNSLDIMLDVNEALGNLKEGTDRNVEGTRIYGRAWAELAPLINLNKEAIADAAKEAKALGLEVGTADVEATQRYRHAMVEVHEVFEGIEVAIGNALLPLLTSLGEWFGAIGPDTVAVFKGAMSVLVVAIDGFKLSFEIAWDALKAEVQSLTVMLITLGDVAWHALKFDFAGAKQAWANGMQQIEDINTKFKEDTIKNAEETQAKMAAAIQKGFGGGDPNNKPIARASGGEAAPEADSKKSRVGDWQAVLAEQKVAFQDMQREQGHFQEFSKEQELQYWQHILSTTKVSEAERIELRKQVAGLELAIDKAKFEEQLGVLKAQEAAFKNNLDAKLDLAKQYAQKVGQAYGMESKEYQAAAKEVVSIEREKFAQLAAIQKEQQALLITQRLAQIDAAEREAQEEAAVHKISDAQLLEQEKAFQQQRTQLRLEGIEQEIAAEKKNPDRNPATIAKLYGQIEQLKAQHNAKMMQMDAQFQKENQKHWEQIMKPIAHTISSSITGMLHGTMTLRKGLQNVGQSILDEFVQIETEKLTQYLATQAAQTAASILGAETRATAEEAGEKRGILATIGAALKFIAINAVKVIAAVWSSISSIPIIGPFLAPALAIAAGAAVFGLASKVASAAGGFDVPSGVNPLTQLHQNEMVLPAQQANMIRQMASSGGPGGGGARQAPQVNVNISAMDGKSVERILSQNGGAVVKALAQQFKRFNPQLRPT